LESTRHPYYYVLDDLPEPVPRAARDAESVRDVVLDVGEGILAQEFERRRRAACSTCDYPIVCPVANARRQRNRCRRSVWGGKRFRGSLDIGVQEAYTG
jgi:hypothetical protein